MESVEKEEIGNDASKTTQFIKCWPSAGENYCTKAKGIILERLKRENTYTFISKHISTMSNFLDDFSKWLLLMHAQGACARKTG